MTNKYLDKCIGNKVKIEFTSNEALIGYIETVIYNYEISSPTYYYYCDLIINNEIVINFSDIIPYEDDPSILIISKENNNYEVNITFEDERSFEDNDDQVGEKFIPEMINYLGTFDCEDCPMNPNIEFETCKYANHCPFDKVAEILIKKY